MSIFNKKFDDITFDDIQELIDHEVEESSVLDYKAQIVDNKKIANLVSAYANTYGGFIVFGIKEKEDSKPEKFVKLKNINNIEDKFQSVCFDCITPPITYAKTKIIEDEKKEIKVFLVHIPESDLTPHAVDNNTRVYMKVGAQKRSVNKENYYKADIPEIEWLKDRRNKFVVHRLDLLEKIKGIEENRLGGIKYTDYILKFSAYLKYPKEKLTKHKSFYNFMVEVIDCYKDSQPGSVINYNQVSHYDRGIMARAKFNDLSIVLNFNDIGYFSISFIDEKEGEPDKKNIKIVRVATLLYHGIAISKIFFNKAGFYGTLITEAFIDKLYKSKLLLEGYDSKVTYSGNKLESTIEPNLLDLIELDQYQSSDFEKEIISSFISKFAFLYNIQNDTHKMGDEIFELSKNNYNSTKKKI